MLAAITTMNGIVETANKKLVMWKLDTQKEWRNTSWCLCDERAERDSVGFMDSKPQMSAFLTKLR